MDAAGSLRASAGYVGSIRSGSSGGGSVEGVKPPSDDGRGSGGSRKLTKTSSRESKPKTKNEVAVAGAALIAEVVLPTLDKVFLYFFFWEFGLMAFCLGYPG